MNILSPSPEEQIVEFFRVLGQPVRVQILLTIGSGEACVCHVEEPGEVKSPCLRPHCSPQDISL